MENIRKYKESDWVHVRNIYDLSKPDEMNGIVESKVKVSRTILRGLETYNSSRLTTLYNASTGI